MPNCPERGMKVDASQPPAFQEPVEPDVRMLDVLHRGRDGFLTFHRRKDEAFRDLLALPALNLAEYFPRVAAELLRDSYVSINGFYRGRGHSDLGPDVPWPYRRASALRWLTALFVDLDVGRDGRQTRELPALRRRPKRDHPLHARLPVSLGGWPSTGAVAG